MDLKRLGPYEILGPIGAGGMGEVYKARDTRLDRTVAVKILPAALAADPQFRERFDREARAISQLTHPHICTLYDVGEQDGTAYLVMQYLDGETLEARLRTGALPIDQALAFAIQIADALDKAHHAGIVHRDLKPGNIMLTKSGANLLDFGLAKTGTAAGGMPGLSILPTTPPNLTAQGTILGTFQYMAPEQLEGHEADARTDIFAFGAVVYEMVTGRKAFEGTSHASLISAIMSSEPPTISTVNRVAPPALDRIVQTCLAKSAEDRWQSARDLVRELKWTGDPRQVLTNAAPAVTSDRRRRIVSAILALVAVAALIPTVFYIRSLRSMTAIGPETQFELQVAGMASPFLISVSPDGRRVVYVAASSDGKRALWVRPLNVLSAQMLPGTEGASSPDWSPDGRFLVFGADMKLKKIDIGGGPPQTLIDLRADQGIYTRSTWNADGTIVFGVNDGRGLRRISASGGDAVVITELDRSLGETAHSTPWFLPDGRHFLYTAWSQKPESRAIYVGSLDSKTRIRLMSAEGKAIYSPPGFILFLRDRTLMARPFDADRLTFGGDAVPLAEEVGYNPSLGQSAFYASAQGTLIYYRSRGDAELFANQQLFWTDRTGKTSDPLGNTVLNFRISPDGKQVAFAPGPFPADVWIHDIERNVRTRLTTDPANDGFPIWSPDGARIIFATDRGHAPGELALYEKASAGAVQERLVLQSEAGMRLVPRDWSSDGRLIVFEKSNTLGAASRDLWVLPLSGDRKPFPYLTTGFDQVQPALSPNGRWLAYMSNESGTYQVVVQPFPDPAGGKWQISTNGGLSPRWRRDGRELYYLDRGGRVVAVSVTSDGKFEVGESASLFETSLAFPSNMAFVNAANAAFDVTADGQRFLMSGQLGRSAATTATPITVVLNWSAALGARERR